MKVAQRENNRTIPMLDLNPNGLIRFTRENGNNVRYNTESLEYENSFVSKPVLKPKYSELFEHQDFVMQELCKK